MAGKYAHITPDLKPEPAADPRYQDRVDLQKETFRRGEETLLGGFEQRTFRLETVSLSSLAHFYRDLRQHKATLEAIESNLNLMIEAADQMFVELAEAEDASSIKLGEGGTVYTQTEPVGKVVDQARFNAWCRKNGYENMMTILWVQMNAITKQRLLDGEPEPDGVEVYARTKVVYRKG